MRYHHNIDNCLAATVNDGGLSDEMHTRMLMAAAPALDRLCQLYESGNLPCLSVATGSEDIEALRGFADDWRARFDQVLILGTGGSSLGGKTLTTLARGDATRGGPRLRYLDNVDPHSCAALLDRLDPRKTGVIAISKSGSTAETLAQMLILLPAFEAVVGRGGLSQHMAVITEAQPSPLADIATHHEVARFDHDPGIGGRFSVFSIVGLLPAMIAGLDVAALRQGAREVLNATLAASKIEDCEPAQGAAVAVGLLQELDITQSVMLTYEDRLADFGLWYRQLWAESLGKDGAGTTPIPALGTADHHSQLQLYLDGPHDKMFTLVMPDTVGRGPVIPAELAIGAGAEGLAGKAIGDLMDAAARATAETLARNDRPVRQFRLNALDEAGLGALLMHFMLETIIAADLLGVDAFDQPAVEQGKLLTRQYLSEGGK